MAAEQQPTIAGGAELCLRSFQECLQQSASIHPREVSLVEDQLARFSIWSASIGVFAPGRASMDHRLREAPDIQEVVRGLLDGLNDGIQNCSSALKAIGDSLPKNSEGVLVVVDENLNRALRTIANEISLLHRLSNTIRRASKESQNFKAAKAFRIKDDDGNDAEQLLQGVFANYILGRFPDISDTLGQRLASTMLLRRKRILYRRYRYGKTPIRPKKVVLQPILNLPLIQQQASDGPEQLQLQDGNEVAAKSTQSIVQSMAVSATTLAADGFKKASTPSVVSQTKTVALGSHEDLIFPPAPTGRLKQKYRQLKKLREADHKAYLKSIPGYVLYQEHKNRSEPSVLNNLPPRTLAEQFEPPHEREIRRKIADAEAKLERTLEKDWNHCSQVFCHEPGDFSYFLSTVETDQLVRAHVKSDLDAYVCLFEECDKPEELYNHSDEWFKHMREHALRWRCNSKSHGALVFDTQAKYLDHMRTKHGAFTEAQLRVLAERNAQIIGPLFESCPFCGTNEVKSRLEDHIVGHLRFLALKSFPPYRDEGSDDSGSETDSLGTSEPRSRSTIKMDPERYLKPIFVDVGEQSAFKESKGGNLNAADPYSPWGGFRGYISQYPAGLEERRMKQHEEFVDGIYAKTEHLKRQEAFSGQSGPKVVAPVATPLFPHLSANGASLGGPLRPRQRFSLPPIPDNNELQPLQWFEDPSTEFVEESLFDETAEADRRVFEWGFVPEANESPSSLGIDPILQSMLTSREAGKNDEDLQERTEVQGKELVKMTTPAFLDENYFRKLQSVSDQTIWTDPISISHDEPGINREAFTPNYFNRFFVEEKELGRGGKGVVLLVRHELDGTFLGKFACKRIPVGDDVAWLEIVLVEVQLLQSLSHPNLVSYRHVWLEDAQIMRFGPSIPCVFILQQYCNSGDLLRYIIPPTTLTKEQLKEQMGRRQIEVSHIRKPRVLLFEEIYSLFKDMISGLAYLHSMHYIHRDLKPSNILLHQDGNEFRCLLSDFGEIQAENVLRKSTGATGTISYCAPEVLKQDESGRYGNYTTKSDIFSIGMVLYFICFGKLPYKSANNDEDEEDIDLLKAEIISWPGFQTEANERGERPELPNQLYELLKSLLAIEPTERPSAKEILAALNGGLKNPIS